jgi:tetratricopeptide (TPR) repeat protein
MTVIPLGRRAAIAAVALVLAGGLFHAQLAAAVLTRGDDALRIGDRAAAVRYYARALALDPHSSRAADRLAFYLAMRHRPGDTQAAIAVATTALARVPNDADLLADRGFAESRLGRWRVAESDFARAGIAGRDPRYDHLAGRVALRLGDVAGARRFFAAALIADPAFDPARAALVDCAPRNPSRLGFAQAASNSLSDKSEKLLGKI